MSTKDIHVSRTAQKPWQIACRIQVLCQTMEFPLVTAYRPRSFRFPNPQNYPQAPNTQAGDDAASTGYPPSVSRLIDCMHGICFVGFYHLHIRPGSWNCPFSVGLDWNTDQGSFV